MGDYWCFNCGAEDPSGFKRSEDSMKVNCRECGAEYSVYGTNERLDI